MTTETYPLTTLGQSTVIRDYSSLLEEGREMFRNAVTETIAGYKFFNCVTLPEFTEILHQGPECGHEKDDGEWFEFPYRHYHLTATWNVYHDLLVEKLQRLMKPFGETLEVKKVSGLYDN